MQGTYTTQCSACATLTEEQCTHLMENFAKRSTYRHKSDSQGDSFEEPETDEPVFTDEDLSWVDDTLLDLEQEDSSTNAPLTGISPLTSLPAPLLAQNIAVRSFTLDPVHQSTTDSNPVLQSVSQDISLPGHIPHSTPGRQTVADKMAALSSQGDSFEEPETDEPVFTDEDLSWVDDTLLDLEPEDSSTNAPLTGISPLTSLPAPLLAQNIAVRSFTLDPVHQSTTDSNPVLQSVSQDISLPGHIPHSTPGRQTVADKMAALSFPQPQRTASVIEIPQTPRTQLIRIQLEQQNFEMMNTLQQKKQQQIKDLSVQLQTELQAFLQQSIEELFNHLAPA